ncbi:MAG: hypothetical protein ACK4NY_18015 [Spirosomataceae bacterium]
MEKLRQYIAYFSSIALVFGVVYIMLNTLSEQFPSTKKYTVENKVYVKDLILVPVSIFVTAYCFKFKPPKLES